MTAEGNAELTKSFHLSFNDVAYSADPVTGNPIHNLFDEADPNKYENRGDNSVTWLSRNNWTGTYPTTYAHLKLNEKMLAEMNQMAVPTDEVEYPTYASGGNLKLIDLLQDQDGNPIDYDYEGWDNLLDQLTYAETVTLVTQGFRSTVQLESIGKKLTVDSNGPVGLTDAYAAGANGLARKSGIDANDKRTPTCYPGNPIVAATLNKELASRVGDAMGEDALWAGYSGLYGPCSNVHRSPYGGRTFEYYSEDAILIGDIISPVIKGLQDHGCYVYNKHFALNDQETNRSGVCTWVNEQTVRENYLEAFRRAIAKADSMCVMTSMNRLGVVCNYANDTLCVDYLRTEIGMKGIAVTDYWSSCAAIVTLALGTSATWFSGLTMALAAFAGAVLTSALIVALSMRLRTTTLLIFGVMLGFIFSAVSSILQYTAGEESLKLFYNWMAGSFSGTRPLQLLALALALILGLVLAVVNGKGLDIILFGDSYAGFSGAPVRRIRTLAMLSASLMTGVVTAFCGPVGFVGIVAPHLARKLLGTASHGALLPGVLLCGSALSLTADILANCWHIPLPVGSTMALVGIPLIIGYLMKASQWK